MDINSYNLLASTSGRWAKVTAFACFAMACGFLAVSLASTYAGAHSPSLPRHVV